MAQQARPLAVVTGWKNKISTSLGAFRNARADDPRNRVIE